MKKSLIAVLLLIIMYSAESYGRAPVIVEGVFSGVRSDKIILKGDQYSFSPENITVIRIIKRRGAFYEETSDLRSLRSGTEITAQTYGAYITRIVYEDY
ncbi:hypothetical protein ADMFC3_16300 [Geovibrio sp. ADMFC3]